MKIIPVSFWGSPIYFYYFNLFNQTDVAMVSWDHKFNSFIHHIHSHFIAFYPQTNSPLIHCLFHPRFHPHRKHAQLAQFCTCLQMDLNPGLLKLWLSLSIERGESVIKTQYLMFRLINIIHINTQLKNKPKVTAKIISPGNLSFQFHVGLHLKSWWQFKDSLCNLILIAFVKRLIWWLLINWYYILMLSLQNKI